MVVNISTEKQKQEFNLNKYLHDNVKAVPLGLISEIERVHQKRCKNFNLNL